MTLPSFRCDFWPTKLLAYFSNKPRNIRKLDPFVPDIYFEEVRLHSSEDPNTGPYIMPLATLRTTPCGWSIKSGCLMCGYFTGATNGDITPSHLIAQTKAVIERLDPTIYPAIVFTSNGSFLDPREVPDDLRPKLLGMLQDAGFKFLTCESRVDFITTDRILALKNAFSPQFGSTCISVSIGVESIDSRILSFSINKGVRKSDYIKAFNKLKSLNVPFDCYVLLGKPFLTAKEDIDDALKTIEFAVESGADYVFVMVSNLVKTTMTNTLAMKGLYRLPSLWRAIELLKRLDEKYRHHVQIKGISHSPIFPYLYSSTCEKCTGTVRDALNFWNQTGDFGHIQSIINTCCHNLFLAGEFAEIKNSDLEQRAVDVRDELIREMENECFND